MSTTAIEQNKQQVKIREEMSTNPGVRSKENEVVVLIMHTLTACAVFWYLAQIAVRVSFASWFLALQFPNTKVRWHHFQLECALHAAASLAPLVSLLLLHSLVLVVVLVMLSRLFLR